MSILPYQDQADTKKKQVEQMFDNIAPKYDVLNRILSLRIDVLWRKKMVRILRNHNAAIENILDVATGTGDVALALADLNPKKIVGLDLSSKMLAVGVEKIKKENLSQLIEMVQGDSEALVFPTATFDAVTVAFGVRNFENLSKGLSEMHRVLNSNGILMVLEFSKPTIFPIKQVYNFYFSTYVPWLGNKISKDKGAYSYLYKSVQAFPEGNDFIEQLANTGFENIQQRRLSGGIATLYWGIKK